MPPVIRTARICGWVALLPVSALPVIALTGAPGWLGRLLITWGALWLAFQAGTLWMRHLNDQPPRPLLPVLAFAVAAAAWPAVILPFVWAMFWLAAVFVLLLVIDEPWQAQGQPGWYRRLRLSTGLVAMTLLIAAGLVRMAVHG